MCLKLSNSRHGLLFFTSALLLSIVVGACSTTGDVRTRSASSILEPENINLSIPLNVQVARLPGVFLSKSGELRIRRELGPPLIVVDGTPMAFHRGLSFLDPAEVARIEVLKGPETAYYGQRGIRGVIKVTTKHEATIRRR